MHKTAKIAVSLVVALMVAWLIGWIMGRSGKPEAQTALSRTELRLQLVDARSRLLEGRVDLFTLNFGNASRRFEEARELLRVASTTLESEGASAAGAQLTTAISRVSEAQVLANKLDQTANARAADAVTATDAVLGALVQ